MSDTYSADNVVPFDPTDFVLREQRSAASRTFSAFDSDPEKATRAQELSEATGVHPAIVYGDLENFENQHKAKLTSQLLNSNGYLRDYINSEPLAPEISHDDLGQLDQVSTHLQQLGLQVDEQGKPTVGSVVSEVAKGFKENFDADSLSEEYKKLGDLLSQNPVFANIFIRQATMAGALALEGSMRLFGGAVGGLAAGVGEAYRQLGGNPADSARLTRDLIVMANVGLAGQAGLHGVVHPEIHAEIAKFGNAVKPYLDAGVEPPVGVHPIVDEMKLEQTKQDLKTLDDLFSEAQKSQTKERSPDIFAGFIRQHGDAKIEVSAEAVREIYGDKPPTMDDGKLGWVPDLAEQLANAEATGGGVSIPLADWLAKADPAVAKDLHDHIRVRPGGVTIEEGKALSEWEKAVKAKAMVEAYHGSPHDFEAFSMDKIGTGEGAQSYGHGLYFAENKEVADSYAKRIVPAPIIEKLAKLEKQRDTLSEGNARDAINEQIYSLENTELVGNNRYRVRINADKEQFLDHDIALNDQPVGKKLLETMDPEFKSRLEEVLESHNQPSLEELTGGEFRQLLQRYASEDALPGDTTMGGAHEKEASEFLKRAGIPGIKYLDQGSRQDGTKNLANAKRALDNEKKAFEDAKRLIGEDKVKPEVLETYKETLAHYQKIYDELSNPTHNFVLFDDSLIEITHKNDQAVTSLREASALKPLLSEMGDRKLTLKRAELSDSRMPGLEQISDAAHAFELHDVEGKTVADLFIAEEKGGKHLYVDDIRGANGFGAGDLGPAAMRDILRQVKTEFPEAETIGGMRVSGARDKAGTWESHGSVKVKLDSAEAVDVLKPRGYRYTTDQGVSARIVPKPEMLEHELEISKKAEELIDRIAGTSIRRKMADVVKMGRKEVQGAYLSFEKLAPAILYSLKAENIPKTVRHEAIHFLRDYNFLTKDEWTTLEREAQEKDWIGKHDIAARYKNYKDDLPSALEEAIAEEFGEWGSQKAKLEEVKAKYSDKAGRVFEKMRSFFDGLAQALKEIFGHSPAVGDLFEMIESGEVAQRGPGVSEGAKDIRAQAGPREPELPGITRMEDREAFDRAPPGMSIERYKKYMRLIEQRHKEDVDATTKRVVEDEHKRQTAEWKANRAKMRETVSTDIHNRPDIAADLLLGSGELFGDKLVSKPKLGSSTLTEEQRAALPKEYLAKDGVSPDDLAGLFGYQSGDELVGRLAALTQERAKAGMSAKAYAERVTEIETDRRMEAKYGDLGKNILDQAKDQVLSETQLDLLHEQTLHFATLAKQEYPIAKDQIISAMHRSMKQIQIGDLSSDKYLAEAGRAGRAAELAFLNKKPLDAFREAQRQELAIIGAKEAKKIEKAREQFDRRAKRFSSREVAGVSPEYTNFIQSVLLRLDEKVKRSPDDLADAIDHGDYKNFNEFVEGKTADLRDLHVPDFLLDPAFAKATDKLTVEEFAQVHDAVKAMEFNGRNELTIEKDGQKQDLQAVLGEMKEAISSLGEGKTYPIDRKPGRIKETGKSWWWSGITVESMLNRIDRDNPNGVFNQYIIRPFTQASNYKDKLIREYQAKVADIGKIPDIDRKVQNDLFRDPLTWEFDEKGKPIPGSGDLLPMRRRNVLGILQNVGNKNNLEKLAKGYGLEPKQVTDWLKANTTPEDWARAQKIGDTFADLFDMANDMSHRISGVGIERLPLEEIDAGAHGKYKGWYNPIKYDPLRPGTSRALLGPSVPEAEGFYRATTPQGYTEKRTGYIAPVELNLDIVPIRMKQMVHDIAMRETVQQLSKVFYNPEFKRAMIKHYGQHQAEEMIPFLRDIANASNFKSMSQHLGDQALEYFRQNTIATLIGLNPSTVMKHGPTAAINSLTEVGVVSFAREFATLLSTDEATSKSNWSMAMDKSEELSRRMRNFQELISGHGAEINLKGANTKFGSVREFLMSAGATPVSISDLLSAVPTWLAKYKDTVAKGVDEGQAVFEADRAVRHAHGSSVFSNKPSIARTNALGAYFSSLYGFFSHMQQKQYELGWKARDAIGDSGQPGDLKKYTPDLIKGFFSYIVAPAVIEEMVTPYTNSDKESWGAKAAKTMALGISSSFIGVRDFVRAVVNVRDPQAGLIGTSIKAGTDLARDLSHGGQAFSKDKAGDILKHSFAMTGVLTGLTNAQEGRLAEYLYRYHNGMEKPKGPWDIAVGARYGKTDKHSRSFDQWLKH